jgi:hypothetical protein
MKTIFRILPILFLLSSCYTKQGALRRFCHQDTAVFKGTVLLKGTVAVPGDSATFNFDCEKFKALYDSLMSEQRNQVKDTNGVTVYKDSTFEVKAKPNPAGGFDFKAKTLDKSVPFEKVVPIEVKVPCNCPDVCNRSWWQKIQESGWYMLWAALFGALAVLVSRGQKKG